MYRFLVVVLLFIPLHALGSWSGFAHVTPTTESKYGLTVELKEVAKNLFRVKLEAVGYDSKRAWLITSPRSLSSKEQMLRFEIWDRKKSPLLKRLLKPKIVKNKYFYDIRLYRDTLSSSYIYIDFPRPVRDGGYYYSIDLPSYLSQYQGLKNEN